VARSEVETLLADPFRPPETPIRPLTDAQVSDYLGASALVPADTELSFLAAQFRPSSPDDAFTAVQSMMEMVYRRFEYVPEVTTISTTVSELLAHPRGVCQDFAHVLIGLCRAVGIAARYVSGYIVADTRLSRETRGVQASHAWVEAFTPTYGWRGFDPTNNLVASEFHVKMAIGRDYADVAPTRGTYRGQAIETLGVAVQTHVEA
jgi:transglutaminase-like putative cysteine protease